MSEPKFGYDAVPYSSFTFPQTRPDRLATLATFFGMQPAPPEKCRVLELGCGDGTNLISFAYILSESSFVGVDLGQRHIEDAKSAAAELQLTNLEFHCEDVMNFSRERYGEFDYIIAHGLFSWVPEAVRTKILNIYSECLTPQGVGHISFNAYPGCKTREMLWDMMKYYTVAVEDPMQKVAGGIQYLNFLNFAAEKESAYQNLINDELSQYKQRTAENIFHDDFSPLNQPFYFHEFATLLEDHDLQFLSEVDAYWTESQLRPEIAVKLDELGDDVIRKEQFTDFIKGRPFRSSLVCRDSIKLDRDPPPNIVRSFYFASQVEPASEQPDLRSSSKEKFKTPDGQNIEIDDPVTKAAVFYLQSIWSTSASFDEVVEQAVAMSGADNVDVDSVAARLLDLFKKGFVYLHRFKPEFPTEAGDRPTASRFVQWQIRRKCADITALSGMNLRPDSDLMKLLLLLCDGTRTRDELTAELGKRIEFPDTQRAEALEQLPELVDTKLADFARLGLLHN